MRMEDIRIGSLADFSNQVPLRAKSASRTNDPDNRDAGVLQFIRKWSFVYTAFQEHYHSDIISNCFLARCESVNDPLESTEASRREKVENF